MTSTKKIIGATVATVAAFGVGIGIGLATSGEAEAHPGHGNCAPTQTQADHPCDPLTFILGEPPVQDSGASRWEDLMLPPAPAGSALGRSIGR